MTQLDHFATKKGFFDEFELEQIFGEFRIRLDDL